MFTLFARNAANRGRIRPVTVPRAGFEATGGGGEAVGEGGTARVGPATAAGGWTEGVGFAGALRCAAETRGFAGGPPCRSALP
ncbi:MAG TPA: hypothetical protein VFG62_17775 [Rhodopila sp.]|nr:hypothetical protein [Rhodopila sp.]